jgi:hypothetical protein
MGIKSRESIYGSSIRASAERAAEARKQADKLACEAWNARMLGYKGPAQPRRRSVTPQCRIQLSRSPLPWLRHASDRRFEHRATPEDDAGP